MNRIEQSKRRFSMLWITTLITFAIVLCGGATTAMAQWTTNGSNINNTNTGNVGIGLSNPSQLLHLSGSDTTGAGVMLEIDNTATSGQPAAGIFFKVGGVIKGSFGGGGFTNLSYGVMPGMSISAGNATDNIIFRTGNSTTGTATGPQMLITAAGNVGIGNNTPTAKLDVGGDVNASGTITGGNIIAKYQDVAEWVPAAHALPAGTVVTLNPQKSNQVMASSQAYDTRVAGVVSAQPGLALGVSGPDKVLVATTGRVKVKVDARRAAIHVGDLLVTGEQEGVAMKSEPLNLGGAQLHRPGTLIGKALEPLESGVGEILVLLSLQ
jgi:hypothetical protein